MEINHTWKRIRFVFFLETYIQTNINTKVKKKHFIFYYTKYFLNYFFEKENWENEST
jgi:hypothetical protein